MKKKLITILAAIMATSFVLCSCSSSKSSKDSKKKGRDTKIEDIDDDDDDETEKTKKKKAKDSEKETEEPTEAPTDPDIETTPSEKGDFDPDLKFSITDLDGNEITESVFSEHKVTMINFWEPWCGPCVGEIPELEKLYENYKDQGFSIIGIFSSSDQIEDVKSLVSDAGVTYAIANYDAAFDKFQTGYVPTTIFVDETGKLYPVSNGYGDNVIVGSASYEEWEKTLLELLK